MSDLSYLLIVAYIAGLTRIVPVSDGYVAQKSPYHGHHRCPLVLRQIVFQYSTLRHSCHNLIGLANQIVAHFVAETPVVVDRGQTLQVRESVDNT